MDLGNFIFFDFFSVGALIPLLFNLLIAYYFWSIPGRSRATFHLAMGFTYFIFFHLGYFIAGSIYHPLQPFTAGSRSFSCFLLSITLMYIYSISLLKGVFEPQGYFWPSTM
jgi:hypothetical protein